MLLAVGLRFTIELVAPPSEPFSVTTSETRG
jgi:hypothetical protein